MTAVSPRKLWVGATEVERDIASAEMHQEQRALVADLQTVGIHVKSVWDLVNWRGAPYPEAVPVLLNHLPILYSDRLGAGIARALSRPYARALAFEPVLQLYEDSPDYDRSWFKDGLAVALSGMARPNDLDVLIDLLNKRENGRTRIFFLGNLARSRKQRALEVIVRLKDDPDLTREVEHILKQKLKYKGKRTVEKH